MDRLTTKQAYEAMMAFLSDFYQRTKSDDVAVLLSGMALLGDGTPCDPAAWEDWLRAVSKALAGPVDQAYAKLTG